MTSRGSLQAAVQDLVRTLIPGEDIQRARRVDHGLDNAGKPILDGRDFLPLRSPDGSVWRIRISDTGMISAKKVQEA